MITSAIWKVLVVIYINLWQVDDDGDVDDDDDDDRKVLVNFFPSLWLYDDDVGYLLKST